MSEMTINGQDARTTYGVRMGKGFLSALRQLPDFKELVSNESRTENGTRYVVADRTYKERELTLPFVLLASSADDARNRESAFYDVLKTNVSICVSQDSDNVYKLIAKAVSSYSLNIKRNLISIKVKFVEPNPTDR